jgi:sugar (pentulose or hexulose) kinase
MTSKPAKTAAPPPASRDSIHPNGPITLSIDIGGSGLKAMLLDAAGNSLCERQRIPTPVDPDSGGLVLAALDELRRSCFPELRSRLGRLSRRRQARLHLSRRQPAS